MDTSEYRQWRGARPISTSSPTPRDLELTQELENILRDEFKLFETEQETKQRLDVLAELAIIVEDWVRKMFEKKDKIDRYSPYQAAQIFTFGSFRLGVNSPGGDIDTLILTCEHLDRENDFFVDLFEILKQNPHVTDLVKVSESFVPLINLYFYGIPFDLTFARLPIPALDYPMMNITDDKIVDEIDIEDEKSVRSINGRRATDKTLDLVPNKETFRLALRCLKQWAKLRGVYSNSVGFLGGITWSLLVARICQMYPNASSSTIVTRFFELYSSDKWNWNSPVLLCPTKTDGRHARLVWNANQTTKTNMSVLTPAYPSQNSASNVSRSTLRILEEEFARVAQEILPEIRKSQVTWMALFEPLNFFGKYRFYLELECLANEPDILNSWLGFMESRLRFLVTALEKELHVYAVHPNPERFVKYFIDAEKKKHSKLENEKSANESGENTVENNNKDEKNNDKIEDENSNKKIDDNANNQTDQIAMSEHTDLPENSGNVIVENSDITKPADSPGGIKVGDKTWNYSTCFFMGLDIRFVPGATHELNLNNSIRDFSYKVYEKRPDRAGPTWDVDVAINWVKRADLPDYVFPDGKRPPITKKKKRRVSQLSDTTSAKRAKNTAMRSTMVVGNSSNIHTQSSKITIANSDSTADGEAKKTSLAAKPKKLDQNVPELDPFEMNKSAQITF